MLEFVKRKFNEDDRKIFGRNVWTTGDIEIIVEQLRKNGAIYNAPSLWKYKLAAKKSLRPLTRHRQKNRRLIRFPLVLRARARRHDAS